MVIVLVVLPNKVSMFVVSQNQMHVKIKIITYMQYRSLILLLFRKKIININTIDIEYPEHHFDSSRNI